MSKRTTISNGIRWVRYFFGFMALVFLSEAFEGAWQVDIVTSLVFLILTWLFYKMRRVRFDDENIYRIYGKKENVVSFNSIKRIEKSGATINSRRMWKLRYEKEGGREASFLFIDGIFQHGSDKELISAVSKVNPSVEVEESYFWNEVEHYKRRRAKRKERKKERNEGKS